MERRSSIRATPAEALQAKLILNFAHQRSCAHNMLDWYGGTRPMSPRLLKIQHRDFYEVNLSKKTIVLMTSVQAREFTFKKVLGNSNAWRFARFRVSLNGKLEIRFNCASSFECCDIQDKVLYCLQEILT